MPCLASAFNSFVFLSWTQLPISKGQAYFTYHQQCLIFYSFLPSFTLTHLLLHPRGKNSHFSLTLSLQRPHPHSLPTDFCYLNNPVTATCFFWHMRRIKAEQKRPVPEKAVFFYKKGAVSGPCSDVSLAGKYPCLELLNDCWWAELNTNTELSCTSSGTSQPC